MYVNPNNSNDIDLPEKQRFNNILIMKDITDVEYNEVQLFIKTWVLKI